MRATRDLLRRRMPLAHTRGALLAHVHNTNSQYNLPAMGNNIADQANRDGVAERCADAAVHKSLEVDLALLGYDDALLRDVELTIVNTARQHDATTLSLLQTVPGIGTMLSLVWLYDIHPIDRFPRVQDFASSCRLGTCARESNGKRAGTSGSTMGHAHLTWAFSEAAVLCLRENPAGQKVLAPLEKKHRKGKALSIFAHTLARAVYDILKRKVAFEKKRCFNDYGRGVGERDVSLDNDGMHLILETLSHQSMTASLNAHERARSRSPSHAFDETPTPAPAQMAIGVTGSRGLLLPRA